MRERVVWQSRYGLKEALEYFVSGIKITWIWCPFLLQRLRQQGAMLLRRTASPLLRALALAPRTQRPSLVVVRHVSDITSSEIARRREEAKKSYDATAGKPSAICDPYDNKGEPLSGSQCAEMLLTVGDAWTLLEDNSALVREIEVTNFMRGAKLLTTLAAVSFNDGHFPTLTLERRKGKGRRWQEVVQVKLQTVVLEGLSFRDFQLAVLMDVELARPV